MSNKGYIYTIVSLLFGLLLMAVITLQYQPIKTNAELEPSKVRTDELHFFVESTEKDMTRGMAISGRRAAAYLVDFIITNNSGVGVANAETALAEMIMNGTVVNRTGGRESILEMENDTMTTWLKKINNTGDELHFDVNLTPISFEVFPYDQSHFLEVFNFSLDIRESKGLSKTELGGYKSNSTKIYVLVSIEGLEDPMYPSRTSNKVKRYMNFGKHYYLYEDFNPPSVGGDGRTYLGSGTWGNGTFGGTVLDLHLETNVANLNALITNFSNNTPQSVEYTVFVFNVSNSTIDSLDVQSRGVLNQSGGVIDYKDTVLIRRGYPYISNATYINFTNYPYVVGENEGVHNIFYLGINEDLKDKTYYPNADNHVNTPSAYLIGPSFFDRLEGSLVTTQKFIDDANLSWNLIGAPWAATESMTTHEGFSPALLIGMESFVNVSEFAQYDLYKNGILDTYEDQSSMDYKYFNNEKGNWIYGTPEWFRLDAHHISQYFLYRYSYDRGAVGIWHFDTMTDDGINNITVDSSRQPSHGFVLPSSNFFLISWGGGSKDYGAFWFAGGNITVKNSEQLNITGPITISAWVRLASFGGANIRPIVSKSTKTYTSNPDSYMLFFGKNKDLNFVLGNNNAWTTRNVSYNINDMALSTWYFVAGTWDGTTANLYVNGAKVNSATIAGPMASNSGNLVFGQTPGAGNYFSGLIDEVKIYNRALSDNEIADEYNRI